MPSVRRGSIRANRLSARDQTIDRLVHRFLMPRAYKITEEERHRRAERMKDVRATVDPIAAAHARWDRLSDQQRKAHGRKLTDARLAKQNSRPESQE